MKGLNKTIVQTLQCVFEDSSWCEQNETLAACTHNAGDSPASTEDKNRGRQE